MAKKTVLIVEDIESLSMAYAAQLEGAGFACIIADTGQGALQQLAENGGRISAVMLDLQLPDVDGLTMLQDNLDIAKNWPVVVATADGSINRAIEAMRLGAYDFLVKPMAPSRLIAIMKSATEAADAKPALSTAKTHAKTEDGFLGFVGTCDAMQTVYRQIENVARSKATVFITGESGTGKEVCAEAIHKASPRAVRPFIAINCGAIPENLLESELFGHLKGSFTGAVSDRIGAVQAASGGTLFLDEICEMELKLQVKLLRFLQTGAVQRVGSSKIEDVDVRIVCATNRNPQAEVAAGRFREDLYYRLAVVPLELPPLRARSHDIELLANAFLRRFSREEGKTFHNISSEAACALAQHSWPGNVRELQNLIRRASVMLEGPDLPVETLLHAPLPLATAGPIVQPALASDQVEPALRARTDMMTLVNCLNGLTLDEIERVAIDNAINRAGGSLPAAARNLGVSPSTLYRKREKWIVR